MTMRESNLLGHIYQQSKGLPEYVSLPPGDDMGALLLDGREVFATVDQLADQIHFDLQQHSIDRIARKAITRNLSDVAAMACQPRGALVAGMLPKSMDEAQANALFDAMRQTGEHYQCPLFGGDIGMWDGPLVLTVTILAQPWANVEPVMRSGAKPGDLLCVTGHLGGSLAEVEGYIHHLDFEPRLTVAKALAQSGQVTAMMDLSDGLGMDAPRLADASGVSLQIYLSQLPVSDAARELATTSGHPATWHALRDGEDYELCFTWSDSAGTHPPDLLEGVPISIIGKVMARGQHAVLIADHADSEAIPLSNDQRGWEHHSDD